MTSVFNKIKIYSFIKDYDPYVVFFEKGVGKGKSITLKGYVALISIVTIRARASGAISIYCTSVLTLHFLNQLDLK